MKKIEKYLIREKIIKTIREFFYRQNFHEVIVPLLNTALPLEPNLRPFITTQKSRDTDRTYYLAMSPERGIKNMLAQGMGDCFAISKSFRNYEQVGTLHMNEFIMLEWYRKGVAYTAIMNDVEQLLTEIDKKMRNTAQLQKNHLQRVSLNDLFEKRIGINLDTLITDEKLLWEVAKKKGYKTTGATWEELYDQLFVNEIESTFSHEAFFLIDFPARISPLCKTDHKNPHFAERFELYIHGIEMGNGNTENTDTTSIQKLFEKESKKTGMPLDEQFLASLEQMKDTTYAGVGIGIDRLTMLYTNLDIFV
ncbi:MAG: amino acid--tRNA ligase-related protein [bacterium]